MMNQMFGSFQTGGRPESVVSEERLNEIFTVQKTADLWKKILLHPNYDSMFRRAARFISQKSGKPFSEVNDFVEKTIKESKNKLSNLGMKIMLFLVMLNYLSILIVSSDL